MGFTTDAYHFYGVHVPKDQWMEHWANAEGERLDSVIHAVRADAPDVGHVTAGKYDEDMLFLAVVPKGTSIRIPLGDFRSVNGGTETDPSWNDQLLHVVKAIGYRRTSPPGWITVPDMS